MPHRRTLWTRKSRRAFHPALRALTLRPIMKLGFVSAILPEFSLDEVLAFARLERFACVEAMCWPVGKAERKFAGVTHVDVTELTPAQADDVNALGAKFGVSLSGLG